MVHPCVLRWSTMSFCRGLFEKKKNRGVQFKGVLCLLKGITDLWHLVLQLYNSFALRHKAAKLGATDQLSP